MKLLANATAEDLAEVRSRAEELETEARAMRWLESALAQRLQNGAPQGAVSPAKAKPRGGARGEKVLGDCRRVAKFLLAGPAGSSAIKDKTGLANASLYRLLKRDWFQKNAAGQWELSDAGRIAVEDGK